MIPSVRHSGGFVIFVGMRFTYRRLKETLERMPLLRALVFLCAGILASRWWLPPLFAAGGMVVCGGMAYLRRSSLYAAAAIALFGIVAAELRQIPAGVPLGRTVLLRMRIEEPVVRRGTYAATTGRLRAWRDDEGRWHPAQGNLAIRCDTALVLRAGDEALCRGRVRLFDAGSYGDLMRARGFAGKVFLAQGSLLERTPGRSGLVQRLHLAAAGRMARLEMKPRNRAVAAAMAAGDRSGLDPELRRIYARTGTSHLLAVSGLHVGVVFLAANLLLGWLPLVRHGHRWRHAAVIGTVWLYAAATGLSASAVRAATMCSLLQLSFLSRAEYASMNALAGAAFLMLAADARWLFDVGFQLSFVAVAGLLAWGVPLHRRMRTGRRVPDLLSGLVLTGLIATVVTAPLAACTFGVFAPAGVMLNPMVVVLAQAIVPIAALWMAAPLPFAAGAVGTLLDAAIGALNALAEWAAGWPSGAFDVRPGAAATAAWYLLFAAVTLLAWSAEPKKTVSLHG